MKKFLKVILIIFASFAGLILAIMLLFVGNSIYQRFPHRITEVEELKYLISAFHDMPVESCDFEWHSDVSVLFFGSLSATASGKVVVTDEYYYNILDDYEWESTNGRPYILKERGVKNEDLYEVFVDFFKNEEYYISYEYQKDLFLRAYLSKDEPVLYFYWNSEDAFYP